MQTILKLPLGPTQTTHTPTIFDVSICSPHFIALSSPPTSCFSVHIVAWHDTFSWRFCPSHISHRTKEGQAIATKIDIVSINAACPERMENLSLYSTQIVLPVSFTHHSRRHTTFSGQLMPIYDLLYSFISVCHLHFTYNFPYNSHIYPFIFPLSRLSFHIPSNNVRSNLALLAVFSTLIPSHL